MPHFLILAVVGVVVVFLAVKARRAMLARAHIRRTHAVTSIARRIYDGEPARDHPANDHGSTALALANVLPEARRLPVTTDNETSTRHEGLALPRDVEAPPSSAN